MMAVHSISLGFTHSGNLKLNVSKISLSDSKHDLSKENRGCGKQGGRRLMVSSSSSNTAISSKWNGQRVSLLRQLSREDVYEGQNKYCFCSLLAPQWTSWMESNSRRRFYGCRKYHQDGGGCGYFAWHDNDFGERANTVIKELLDDIDRLYDENNMLRRGKDERIFIEEVDAIRGEVRKLKYKHEMNDMQHKQGQMKFKIAMSLLLITWIWLFVCYVM